MIPRERPTRCKPSALRGFLNDPERLPRPASRAANREGTAPRRKEVNRFAPWVLLLTCPDSANGGHQAPQRTGCAKSPQGRTHRPRPRRRQRGAVGLRQRDQIAEIHFPIPVEVPLHDCRSCRRGPCPQTKPRSAVMSGSIRSMRGSSCHRARHGRWWSVTRG